MLNTHQRWSHDLKLYQVPQTLGARLPTSPSTTSDVSSTQLRTSVLLNTIGCFGHIATESGYRSSVVAKIWLRK